MHTQHCKEGYKYACTMLIDGLGRPGSLVSDTVSFSSLNVAVSGKSPFYLSSACNTEAVDVAHKPRLHLIKTPTLLESSQISGSDDIHHYLISQKLAVCPVRKIRMPLISFPYLVPKRETVAMSFDLVLCCPGTMQTLVVIVIWGRGQWIILLKCFTFLLSFL